VKNGDGWKADNIQDIPPMKDSFTKGWHSVRWHLGIEGFGVNAITRNKDEWLTKEHDELETGQQELFVILEGHAEFTLDGEKLDAPTGIAIAVDPEVKRSADALVSPTTMLIIGAPTGKSYKPPSWA
jgi:mannose-6-phosphate isomerase-like protein (cupin superfamily)